MVARFSIIAAGFCSRLARTRGFLRPVLTLGTNALGVTNQQLGKVLLLFKNVLHAASNQELNVYYGCTVLYCCFTTSVSPRDTDCMHVSLIAVS